MSGYEVTMARTGDFKPGRMYLPDISFFETMCCTVNGPVDLDNSSKTSPLGSKSV